MDRFRQELVGRSLHSHKPVTPSQVEMTKARRPATHDYVEDDKPDFLYAIALQ